MIAASLRWRSRSSAPQALAANKHIMGRMRLPPASTTCLLTAMTNATLEVMPSLINVSIVAKS